jgi:hypothetical protein
MSNTRNLAGLLNSSGLVPLPTKVAGVLPDANAPSGSVIQVVSVTKTDTQSFLSVGRNSFQNITGLSLNITPSSTSSKILIIGHVNAVMNNTGSIIRIARNATVVGNADSAGLRTLGHSTINFGSPSSPLAGSSMPLCFLDAPNSTSALTYQIQVGQFNTTSGTIYVNRQEDNTNSAARFRAVSVLTVMEIAA